MIQRDRDDQRIAGRQRHWKGPEAYCVAPARLEQAGIFAQIECRRRGHDLRGVFGRIAEQRRGMLFQY